jgi:hypothetical protein
MQLSTKKWLKITLFNLFIVVAIGAVLRYKIVFSLPFINQKHLLHGHSHFAFAGWISQALLIFLVDYIAKQKDDIVVFKKYSSLLKANLITAYGMLIAFSLQGYNIFSIAISFLSIIVSYIFTVTFWRDLNRLKNKNICHNWFKAALAFNVISSFGAFALALLMIKKLSHQNWYLAAEYFYLHFQYNGWFFFCCMGLLMAKLYAVIPKKIMSQIFISFFVALIPAYFLSALWMNIPNWVYVLVVFSAIIQVWGWVITVRALNKEKNYIKNTLPRLGRWVLLLSAIALSFKLLLQLGSTIPTLSTLAFGFRPIVIGYLHLVLLGVISLFILGYMFVSHNLIINKGTTLSIKLFCFGVIITEILLMTQGITSLYYIYLPYINEMLFITALLMLSSTLVLNYSNKKS